MERTPSVDDNDIQNKHRAEMAQLEEAMSSKAAAQLLAQEEVARTELQRHEAVARMEMHRYREESIQNIQSIRSAFFELQANRSTESTRVR